MNPVSATSWHDTFEQFETIRSHNLAARDLLVTLQQRCPIFALTQAAGQL